MSTYHSHVVTRGSMKLAHNLDDLKSRGSIRDEIVTDDKPVVAPISQDKWARIRANLAAYKAVCSK